MKKPILLILFSLCGSSHAYDGPTSQLSHVMGGAVLAGVVARQFQESEHRAWIGFAASTVGIVLTERAHYSRPDRRHGAQLDVASHALGAALGAWYTDRYGLTPWVSPRHVGLVWTLRY